MHDRKRFSRNYYLFVMIYALLALLFFWIVNENWRSTVISTDPINRDTVLPELSAGSEIRQDFIVAADQTKSLTLHANKQAGISDAGILRVSIASASQIIFSTEIHYSAIGDDGEIVIPVESVEALERGGRYTLILYGDGGLAFWCGKTRTAGKFQINVETNELHMDGQPIEGELVMSQTGAVNLYYMDYYWLAVIVIFILLTTMILYCRFCYVHEKKNLINQSQFLIKQYRYLLKTLVIRDFKIKYKASVLGVLWSFLNPLLMTFVYMFVFSTLFRSSIENFVVYLMSGIILFNYFSEATNLGMQSIVGNAGLITKVYMPKYVFPISKVLSSGINLAISLIPLLIMMALTGVHFTKSLLLIPVVLMFLILFCVGVSLILSAAMVYFRDIQFLWGILITILNFLSPIFYPESIIPVRFQVIYHMNPLYQYLFFMRTIILGGISPTPTTYFYCILASMISLLLGFFVFKRTQSSFVLHL